MSKKNKCLAHPKWSYNANIYEVNIRQYTAEGTFAAFSHHLPRLKDMGIKILWFMPITPIGKKDRLGTLGSYYSVLDYTAVNPEFGTMDDFKNLVSEAHALNMKVIIDFVTNHTSNDHSWVTDFPDYYVRDEKGDPLHPQGWMDVSELNYKNRKLQEEMIKVLKFWVRECNIDGYRCDMAHLVPLSFWIKAKNKVSRVQPNLFWLAECEEPEYHEVFDATYTWRWMHATSNFYKGQMSLQSLLTVLYKSVTEFPCNAMRAYFTSNHDENSWNGTEYEKYGSASSLFAVFSCTWNGIPLIYSGQELPNKKRLKFFDKDEIEWQPDTELHKFYKKLLTLKSNNPALKSGDASGLTKIISHPEDPEIFAYLRKNGNDEVLVILNPHPEPKNFEIRYVKGVFKNIFGGPDVNLDDDNFVYLHPWGHLVFEKIKLLS